MQKYAFFQKEEAMETDAQGNEEKKEEEKPEKENEEEKAEVRANIFCIMYFSFA